MILLKMTYRSVEISASRDIDDFEQRSIWDTVVWLRPVLSIPMACPRSSVLSLAIETMLFVLSHWAIVYSTRAARAARK